MLNLNFNELAWKAPKHDGKVGYLPSDKYYEEIINWLKTGSKLYKESCSQSNGTQVIVSRVSFRDSEYDAVVTFIPSTKMIMYLFRKANKFSI